MYKFLFLFLFSCVSAQHYRFVYEYTMKPDSHKKDSTVTDYMNLDTDGRTSYFYNAAKYERDSVYQADKSYAKLLAAKTFDQNLGYIIEKEYSRKAITLYDRFKTANLSVLGLDAPVWKIRKEFRTINNIPCQKATAQYKGRDWEAWFSKDYPVSDGPYTFTGLPGIVVQAQDAEKDHVFNLIQVKKVPAVFSMLPKSGKKVSLAEYRKIMNSFTFSSEDIEGMNVNKETGNADLQLKGGYTARFGLDEMKKVKNMDAEIARRLRRTNNPIEKN
ncbi:GLPGLI family protein [uncultured Chryseobacterium sp.]|uniref:GLPGLI family protein n=1 Tax=uncultured Chryseobacterium sp. TaxID=259322 RepID=UPI0025EBEF68|nr:GLPGLI family protein [uncultured Chryseobacterium sp.]